MQLLGVACEEKELHLCRLLVLVSPLLLYGSPLAIVAGHFGAFVEHLLLLLPIAASKVESAKRPTLTTVS